jgi:hypothetical protein
LNRATNSIVGGRDNPRASFAGHKYETPWDPLHRAYFSGYAMWTYLNTPFLMALPGFVVEEMAPWKEDGETWCVLRAKFPAAIASHCQEQDFYFGPDLLLRRHDYKVDIAGSFPTAQYVYDAIEAVLAAAEGIEADHDGATCTVASCSGAGVPVTASEAERTSRQKKRTV